MTELIMGGLITRARARRRATRRLRESAYGRVLYLLVSRIHVSCRIPLLALLLLTYGVCSFMLSGYSMVAHEPSAGTFLFYSRPSTWCTTSCCRRRSVAGERMQHDCSSSRTAVEELGSGKAGACASGGGVAPCPRGGSTTSRDRARAATCAEESIRRESKSA